MLCIFIINILENKPTEQVRKHTHSVTILAHSLPLSNYLKYCMTYRNVYQTCFNQNWNVLINFTETLQQNFMKISFAVLKFLHLERYPEANRCNLVTASVV
jgi:hypothetical protein